MGVIVKDFMNSRAILFSFFIFFSLQAVDQLSDRIQTNFIVNQNAKPKILIATSKGGGAHYTVTQVLTKRLEKAYTVTTTNILTDIWGSFDPLSKITFGLYSGEDLYNYFLKNSWNRAINILGTIGDWHMDWFKKSLTRSMSDYLKEYKPDLVISVVPVIDPYILWACEENNIPFLVINLDTDASIYLRGVKAPTYKNFYFTVPFDDALLYEKIAAAELPKSCLKPIGFPIRESFFEKKCKGCIKEAFDIPEDTPTVMIMMGGQGSELSYTYTRALARNTTDTMHLIVCLGRNEKLAKRIKKIKLPKNITLTVVGFTDKIADLMAVSDVLITKPGPTTMCEALHMQLPLILSGIGEVIRWEQTNIDFVVKNQLGGVVKNTKEIIPLVREWLTNKTLRTTFKENVVRYNQASFRSSFDVLVRELLESKEEPPVTSIIVQ